MKALFSLEVSVRGICQKAFCEVNFAYTMSLSKLIDDIFKFWHGLRIKNSHLVQLSVVYT